MLRVIIKLFHISPLIQVFISFFCFGIVSFLLLSWQLYSHGLNTSFSGSVPHISVFTDVDSTNTERIVDALSGINEIRAVSSFVIGSRTLRIESKPYPMIGRVKTTANIRLIGIDLDSFPFIIPFEDSRPLRKTSYANQYTSKELSLELIRNERAVIVNEAMANIFFPPNPAIEDRYTVYSVDNMTEPISQIQIIAVIKDLLDIPLIFMPMELANEILDPAENTGVSIRLFDRFMIDDQSLNEAQRKIVQAIEAGKGRFKKVANWKQAENKQKSVFRVFEVISILIGLSIILPSIFAGVLGIFRTFVIKQNSISTLMRLGTSKLQLFRIIAVINTLALIVGFILAFALVQYSQRWFTDFFLKRLRQIVFVQDIDIHWSRILYIDGVLFAAYTIIFLIALFYIINNKQPIKL